MKVKIRNPFSKEEEKPENDTVEETGPVSAGEEKKKKRSLFSRNNKNVIEQDTKENKPGEVPTESKPPKEKKQSRFSFGKKEEVEAPDEKTRQEIPVRSRNAVERISYNLLASHLPGLEELRETYSQSGLPLIFEAYISSGFLLSMLATIPTFAISLIIETRLYPRSTIFLPIIGSIILSGVAFGLTLVIWLSVPMIKRRSGRAKLWFNWRNFCITG